MRSHRNDWLLLRFLSDGEMKGERQTSRKCGVEQKRLEDFMRRKRELLEIFVQWKKHFLDMELGSPGTGNNLVGNRDLRLEVLVLFTKLHLH